MPFTSKTSKIGTFGCVEYDESAKYPVKLGGIGGGIGTVAEAREWHRDLGAFLADYDGDAVPVTSAYVGNASIAWRNDPRDTLDQPVRVKPWVRIVGWTVFVIVCATLAVGIVSSGK